MKHIHLVQGRPQQWWRNADIRIIISRPGGGGGGALGVIFLIFIRGVRFSEYTQSEIERALNINLVV
jgi:hypothetical protein